MAKKQVTVSLRKPPSPEALDSFVKAGAEETPVAASAQKRARRAKAEASPTPPSVVPESGVQATAAATAVADEVREEVREEVAATAIPPVAAREPLQEPVAEPVKEASVPVDVTPTMPVVGPSGITLRPVTVYLPPELAERLTMHCIQQDRDMSNVIGEAIANHLSPRLGAGPSPTEAETKQEESARSQSHAWGNAEKPFPRIEWPPRKIAEILEVGRVLFGVLRRRVAVG